MKRAPPRTSPSSSTSLECFPMLGHSSSRPMEPTLAALTRRRCSEVQEGSPILLDVEGVQLEGLLEYRVAPAQPGENPSVTIDQAEGVDVPWETLRHLILILPVNKSVG